MTATPNTTPSRAIPTAVTLLAICVFLWPALMTFDAGDWPSPDRFPNNVPTVNACGIVGAWFAYHLRLWLGVGAFPLLILSTVGAVRGLWARSWTPRLERLFGLVLVVVGCSAIGHLLLRSGPGSLAVGEGGIIGFAAGRFAMDHLGRFGTSIVLFAAVVVGLMFATNGSVLRLPGAAGRGAAAMARPVATVGRFVRAVGARLRRRRFEHGVTAEESDALLRVGSVAGSSRRKNDETLWDEEDERDGEASDATATASHAREATAEGGPGERASRSAASADKAKATGRRGRRGKRGTMPVVNFPTPNDARAVEPYPREIENWRLPSPTLLRPSEYEFSAQQEQDVRRQAQVLEQTLEEFRLNARVVEIDTGPVITMFELKLGAGIKVSQIATLSNDIARALKAPAIRVVAPISGKNTVGIEVPNTKKEVVRLRELMELSGKSASEMQLPLFLGKDAGGGPLVADLATMPHLLIAGTTGSGKSVCLNGVILSLLMAKRPDHVKLIIIDPKMVEMSRFKDVPHLMSPIVTDMARAEKILEWAVTKMDERYELLAEARVRHVTAYNALGRDALLERLAPETDEEAARISAHLPYIVIIIDELADLMMTTPREVEHHLCRLAQKSRAVGIHIIVATQRPEAKVVTGLIKSNLPSRICFRVASRMDSRIVLDRNGGEVLLGQGDMLFLPPGSHKLKRAQGTFLEDAEVQAVLDDLTSRAKPEFHPDLMRIRSAAAGEDTGLRDPMFDQAVRVVLQSQRGSVSLLQRRLGIGYSRASRLIEQMAGAGLVGDHKGSQAREVFLSLEAWDSARDAAGDDDAEDPTSGAESIGEKARHPAYAADEYSAARS